MGAESWHRASRGPCRARAGFLILVMTVFVASPLCVATPLTTNQAVQLAEAALNGPDGDALRELKRASEEGDPAGQYGLALYDYSATQFRVKDPTGGEGKTLADALLEKAAARGYPAAENRLCRVAAGNVKGVARRTKDAVADAIQHCERAAHDGIAQADWTLAQMALDGAVAPGCPPGKGAVGSQSDPGAMACRRRAAIPWLRLAAKAGIARAQHALGKILRDGAEGPDGAAKGAQWLLLAAAHTDVADDDPWDGGWVHTSLWSGPRAACVADASLAIPTADLPPTSAVTGLAGCNSEDLYYGIDAPPDYTRARWCAYLERPEFRHGNGWGAPAFAGPSILMMIYANGRSVPRNIPLATKFACEEGWGNAAADLRLAHLDKIAADPHATPIDVCDDETSGEMQGACAGRDSEISTARRATSEHTLESRLAPAERTAYVALRARADQFITTRADNEVDQSGTGRGAFVAEEYDRGWKSFSALIDASLAHQLVPASAGDVRTARAELDQAYRSLLASPGFKPFESGPMSVAFGTVQPSGISSTQAAWEPYLHAWSEFAKTMNGGTEIAAIDWAVIEARLAQLQILAWGGSIGSVDRTHPHVSWVAPGTFEPSAEFERDRDYAAQAIHGDHRALVTLRQGAEAGNVDAQTWLAVCSHKTGDNRAAARWAKAAADQGQPDAEGFLGSLYNRGWGVPEDPRTAQVWWLLAARSGVATALFNLGTTITRGRGRPADPELGLALMEAAQRRGVRGQLVVDAIAAARSKFETTTLYAVEDRAMRFANAPASIPPLP